MAHAVDFPERNDWLGKPENTTNHQVFALRICRFITYMPGVIPTAPLQKVHAFVSCWEITDEEWQLMTEDPTRRKIYLKFWGFTMPPANVFAGFLPIDTDHPDHPDIILTQEDIDKSYGR